MSVSVGRPAYAVVAAILDNLQDIVRSEAHLVKVELQEKARAARSPATRIGVGLLLACYAIGLFIATAVVLLARVVEVWAAAGIVCLVVACAALVVLSSGKREWKRMSSEKAAHTLEEHVNGG